jgi:enoyl-CoA hydratase/carnithine racemase
MTHALRTAEGEDVEVVVIRGDGPSFCAGADLAFLETHDGSAGITPREFLSSIWDLTIALESSPIAVVAGLHGHAIAGGLELALACDVVVAAESTILGDGHVLRCLLPGGGASARMERTLGRATSSWLALTGDLLPAADPVFAQWLRRVVPEEELSAAIDDVVARLLATPSAARRSYKLLLDRTHGRLDATDRDRELDAFDEHWTAHDVPAVLRDFLAKNRKAS